MASHEAGHEGRLAGLDKKLRYWISTYLAGAALTGVND
jgi:hypothetical protein